MCGRQSPAQYPPPSPAGGGGMAVARATGIQYGGRILTLSRGTPALVHEPEAASGKQKAGTTVSSLFGPGPTRDCHRHPRSGWRVSGAGEGPRVPEACVAAPRCDRSGAAPAQAPGARRLFWSLGTWVWFHSFVRSFVCVFARTWNSQTFGCGLWALTLWLPALCGQRLKRHSRSKLCLTFWVKLVFLKQSFSRI